MPALREFIARLAGLLRRRRDDGRVEEEIRAHLAELETAFTRRGMTPEQARREARVAFGNVELVREDYRTQRSFPSVEFVANDLRYAARLLARHPGFTVTAVLTLALGIGLNATLFTTVDAVMFRPLPVRDGDRLVRFERWFASQRQGNGQYLFTEQEYRYLSDHGRISSRRDFPSSSEPTTCKPSICRPCRRTTSPPSGCRPLPAAPSGRATPARISASSSVTRSGSASSRVIRSSSAARSG